MSLAGLLGLWKPKSVCVCVGGGGGGGGAEPALKLALGGLTCIWSQRAFRARGGPDAKPHRFCTSQSQVWVWAVSAFTKPRIITGAQ